MKENRGSLFNRIRLITLILSIVGLGVDALRADSKIVVIRPDNFNPAAICGFDFLGEIKLCATDATDTCIWEATEGVGKFGRPVTTDGNVYGDTITFSFEEDPKNGAITVKIVDKANHDIVKGTAELQLFQVPKASVVSDITWDQPICENIPVEFKLPVETDYDTKYLPGQLHFAWTFLKPEWKDWTDYQHVLVPVDGEENFAYSYTFETSDYDGGKVVVTPYTCDGPTGTKYRTNATDRVLSPFIIRGLYSDKPTIQPLKRKDGELEEGEDKWEAEEVAEGEMKSICRDYSDEKGALWNKLNGDGSEGRVYLGFGDFQTWLDAEDKSTLPEYYYSYTWEFDEEEFVADEAKMEQQTYQDMGFGLDKSRIVLRVMGGKNDGADKIHTVKLTVRCDTCIARGGYPADFTYTSTIRLERYDSITDFRNPDNPIDYVVQAEGYVCAGKETTLRLSMDNVSQIYFEELSNADYFILEPKKPNGNSAGWQETGSTKDGDDNIYTFETARTDYTGRVGDTIYMSVYPANTCFRNMKDTSENGKLFKIFVRNPPLPPTLYDPIFGKAIKPQYTERYWEGWKQAHPGGDEEQEISERVQVCNYTTMQNSAWLNSTQTFGLLIKNDSLYNPDGGRNAFRIWDMDEELNDESGRGQISYQFETRTASSIMDSSWVSLSVYREARQHFENTKEVKFGFNGFNVCGAGDTGIYVIRIIDTLTVTDILSNQYYNWDTICEGLEVDVYSSENYVTTWDVQGGDPADRENVETDRVEYDWKVPSDWTIKAESSRDGRVGDKALFTAGSSSGAVQLRFGNRCGYSNYMGTDVFVYPFARFQIIGDTTPCRGDTIEYKFVKPEFRGLAGDSIHYVLGFPAGVWSIVGPINGMALEDDTISMSFNVADLANKPISIGGYYWNSAEENPMPHLSPGVNASGCVNINNNSGAISPKHYDSLAVNVKPYTSKPIVVDKVDTVCADHLYRFDVKKGAEVDDSVFFRWFFPTNDSEDPNDDWTEVDYSTDGDTVDFMTPVGHSRERHTIRVVSNRYDCEATNKGDTLDIPVLLMDTLQVKGDFYDAELGKRENKLVKINHTPCEGDTVAYTLWKQLQDGALYYSLFECRSLDGDDAADGGWAQLAASDWKILSEEPYHDTLKMVVGRDPLRLRAANVSLCDTSSFKEDTIRPICKVIAPGQITVNRPDDHLCEYEAVNFTFKPVEHATHYVFHYPWGNLSDTVKLADTVADREAGRLTEDGLYQIRFADTFAYADGTVYLEAYNVCGVRPTNDERNIISVFRQPKTPVLARMDFADVTPIIIGSDTVGDTICLRKPLVLEAAPNDKIAADAAGWRFHYAWSLTQPDESVTVFEKYNAVSGLNAGDSLWTMTKEVSETEMNYIWLTSRHETCERFGDTLTIALQSADTTALPEGTHIGDYLRDKISGGIIQIRPCAKGETDKEVAYYLDLAKLDARGTGYYFRWRKDSTTDYTNTYDPTDGTLAGGHFVLNNIPADGDGDGQPDWETLDTLKMTLPSVADTLEIQVVVKNRCDYAHLPGLTVQTSDAISLEDAYEVVQVSEHICDKEELRYKVVSIAGTDTVNGVPKAGQYVWYTPWNVGRRDTTVGFTKIFDTLAYRPGKVYVIPNNGCGDGHKSDSIEIQENDILQPPARVTPVVSGIFASDYDAEAGFVRDSVCLRAPFGMAVEAELLPYQTVPVPPVILSAKDGERATEPRDSLVYRWTAAIGKATNLTFETRDSSQVELTIPNFADSLHFFYVAARRSVCRRFGDSLRISIFPMDTLRFINDPVEDSLPYDRFAVQARGVLLDIAGLEPSAPADSIQLRPCVESTHIYSIRPGFHWSLSTLAEDTPYFTWNGGQKGAGENGILNGTAGWQCADAQKLQEEIYIGKVGAPNDVLNLSVHAKNICGTTVSKPLAIRPHALIDENKKPVFKELAPLCQGDTLWLEVEPVADADVVDGYVWRASWLGKPDTTAGPRIGYPDYNQEYETVTVYAYNNCGDGAESEPLALMSLLRKPDRPEPKWFAPLTMSPLHDTVYDTLCLHGNNLLRVKSNIGQPVDGETDSEERLFYRWEILPDYMDYAELVGSTAEGLDSIYVLPAEGVNEKGSELRLMVASRRAACHRWSDTLFIVLHLTDTVPVSELGSILWYQYDPAMPDSKIEAKPEFPLCPGTTIRLGVANEDAAPAYRWQLPDPTWRFSPSPVDNTTAAVVDIVVGERSGAVRVSPITDPYNRQCTYAAEANALQTEQIVLKPALPARQFVTEGPNAFNESPCAGVGLTYAIREPYPDDIDILRYRWVFPKGWRVYDAEGNLTDTNALEPTSLTCRVLPDSSSGMVRAYVLSQCEENDPTSVSVSQPVERAVRPMDTARFAIIADETVCKDSLLTMEIKALNEWTFNNGYGLNVSYIGSDATVITDPDDALVFSFPNAPDSSLVEVRWYSGDSTRVTFTPRHTGGCPNVLPATYALKADTIPAINGRILGPERICMGAEAIFTAQPENIPDGVEVTYHWEVPEDEGWEIVSGSNSMEAVIRAGWYENELELERAIRCYPRAFCGTAAPFVKTLTINPPANFNGTLKASYLADGTPLTLSDRPCIGSDLAFDLTHDDAPVAVRYVWETPDGWNRLSVTGTVADSLLRAEFTASRAGEDTVRVRFLDLTDPKSCGLSRPVDYAIAIRDSAPAARLKRPPYPCNTRPAVEFVLVPDEEIDSAAWTWPVAYNPPLSEVSTTEESRIKYNKLTVRELTPGDGFTEAFELAIRTTNVCGYRDTLIRVTPVGPIPPFPADSLRISHYCLGDSAYAYAGISEDYVEKGTEYIWRPVGSLVYLYDSVVRENDDPAGVETVAWMRFAAGKSAIDTSNLYFYAQNDCNATDTVSLRTAPYTYAILAKPGKDTVVYGQSGVALAVVSTQYGTLDDYTYVWYPEDRVSLSDPAAPDASGTTFATQGLYNRHEYFRVIATERIDTARPFYFGRSACTASDTVTIFVDSTFTMRPAPTDTVCMNETFELSTHPYGGNVERYYFDWYRLTADSVYEPLEGDDHAETLTIMVDAPTIRLMVIGRDSTFVYADAEAPETPADPEETPTDPDIPVEDPEADLLYVFSQVDTQYIELQAFEVNGRWILPGKDSVEVPFGTKVHLSAEATGGGWQYIYHWETEPAEMLDQPDSTSGSAYTKRLYEDCNATLTLYDTVTGCTASLQIHIGMSDEIGDIPNAFSPNGDGINDIFMKGTDLVIFDRFGRELFRSSDRQEGWDGTFKGTTVRPGEYLYVVTIRRNGHEYIKKGTVTVFTK